MKDIFEVIDNTMDNIEKSFDNLSDTIDNLSDTIYKRLDKDIAKAENVKIIQVGNDTKDFSLLDRLLYFAVGFAAGFIIQQYLI